jgi:hypothetical protein
MFYYLDDQLMAHVRQNEAGTLAPWGDTAGFFAGKCQAFVEGYRVVPEGQAWTREDGADFSGLMIAPATDPKLLSAAQAQADEATIEELDAAVVDLTYQNILLEYEAQ